MHARAEGLLRTDSQDRVSSVGRILFLGDEENFPLTRTNNGSILPAGKFLGVMEKGESALLVDEFCQDPHAGGFQVVGGFLM